MTLATTAYELIRQLSSFPPETPVLGILERGRLGDIRFDVQCVGGPDGSIVLQCIEPDGGKVVMESLGLQELIDMVGVEEAAEMIEEELSHGPARLPGESVFDYVARRADLALQQLEGCFGPEYQLTLVARCTRDDLDDADMLVTRDDLVKVLAAVQKRICDGGES